MRVCGAKRLADPWHISSPDPFLPPQSEIEGIKANP